MSSFALQISRFPLAMLLVKQISYLDLYFIIMSVSLPVQFFATEILLFKGVSVSKNEVLIDRVIYFVWFVTLVYLFYFYGLYSVFVYFIFSICLVFYNIYQYVMRETVGAKVYLFNDMAVNFFITTGVIFLVLYSDSKSVSLYIMFYMSTVFAFFGSCFFFVSRKKNFISIKRIASRSEPLPYFFQVFLMINTQAERLLVGAIWPTFLGYIAIAAAAAQAWRRLVLDDSVLFDRLAKNTKNMTKVIFESFHIYWLWSVLFIFIAFLIITLFKLFVGNSFQTERLIDIGLIFIIYLNALPAGILSINLIRLGVLKPSNITFLYLFSTILFFLIALFFERLNTINIPHYFVWFFVFFSALINNFLYRDVVEFFLVKYLLRYRIVFFLNLLFIIGSLYAY